MNDDVKSFDKRASLCVLIAVIALIAIAFIVSSCGLTRIASTEAKYYQSGDTTVQIVTKTTTTIDAKTQVPISTFIK